MANEGFYTRVRGKVSGPFDVATLQKMVRRGGLSRIHEVSSDRQVWSAAGEYEDLFPASTFTIAAEAEPEPQSSGGQITASVAEAPPAAATATAAETLYFYTQRGTSVGPVPISVLRTLAENGTLHSTDLVWKDGDSTGVAAWQVPTISRYFNRQLNHSVPNSDPYAGFWRRFGAWVVDSIILFTLILVIVIALGFTIASVMANHDARGRDIATVVDIVGRVVGLLIPWLYYAFFESSSKKATPGKIALGLIVTRESAERISFGRATGRYFGKYISAMILGFGFFMAGWTEKKQGLHDLMAGTLVVNK